MKRLLFLCSFLCATLLMVACGVQDTGPPDEAFEKLSELRSRLIVDLQAKYDLHIREVMRLRVEDLDVDTGHLKVYDASYEELDRVLYIQPEHLDLFEEWAEQRKEYERLFYHK